VYTEHMSESVHTRCTATVYFGLITSHTCPCGQHTRLRFVVLQCVSTDLKCVCKSHYTHFLIIAHADEDVAILLQDFHIRANRVPIPARPNEPTTYEPIDGHQYFTGPGQQTHTRGCLQPTTTRHVSASPVQKLSGQKAAGCALNIFKSCTYPHVAYNPYRNDRIVVILFAYITHHFYNRV
jgi:hypothetical protein